MITATENKMTGVFDSEFAIEMSILNKVDRFWHDRVMDMYRFVTIPPCGDERVRVVETVEVPSNWPIGGDIRMRVKYVPVAGKTFHRTWLLGMTKGKFTVKMA